MNAVTYYMDHSLMEQRLVEIKDRIDCLIATHESGEIDRAEYLDKLIPLVSERTAIERIQRGK